MTYHIATMDRGVFETFGTKIEAVRFVRKQVVGRFSYVRKLPSGVLEYCKSGGPTYYLGTKLAMREDGWGV